MRLTPNFGVAAALAILSSARSAVRVESRPRARTAPVPEKYRHMTPEQAAHNLEIDERNRARGKRK